MADKTINTLDTELVSVGANDLIGVWDVAAAQYKKAKRSNLVGATITGAGTIATGGFTLTVPSSMTAAGRNVANDFTAAQRVIGATLGALMASSGNGQAIRHIGAIRAATMTVANGQAFTFTFDGDACLFGLELGYASLHFASYISTTIVELADPDTIVPGFVTLAKGASARVITVTNVSGSSRNISIMALSPVSAFTNPA